MSTFTFRVTSSATNTAGSAYGQQPDLGTPSFLDLYISGSTDPLVPNGQYDAYCLNPLININLSPTTYSAENMAGNTAASFVPIGFSSMSQTQVDQINWLLSQNFTSDAKYGGQYNFGEVQTAKVVLAAVFGVRCEVLRQQPVDLIHLGLRHRTEADGHK